MEYNDTFDGGCLREKQVRELVPISRSTLWDWVRDGTFPAPTKLSSKVTVWRRAEVQAWLDAKFQEAS